MQTPVALFVFNRPDTTERVFAQIAKARPRQLFVVGDGPRANRIGEAALVAKVQKVATSVDWPCQLATHFSPTNLGCKRRVSSGLKWLFSQVEEAIILEDDCLPHPTFFPYCETMLETYRNESQVSAVNGTNAVAASERHGDETPTGNGQYTFSKYFECWGWATWRRAWEQFDVEMADWPRFLKSNRLREMADHFDEELYWRMIFQQQYHTDFSSWAYPWQFSSWNHDRLCIMPPVNLISNIGVDERATHTTKAACDLSNFSTSPYHAIPHQNELVRDPVADLKTFHVRHLRRTGTRRIVWRIKKSVFPMRRAA
ncbi:glycosyltransferase family protein [Lignipirellula cremea]|uniref:GNT-I family protein n=1 Tax=Lignipirellula cremea TaxID=2528010 RepID=A0A518DRZ7_9BACT|nr:glycosyltransferase family 2 protein [Lignipirellula cremea]QDU94594.1 hypothetical protein Pla8534_23870 [Lignipirellula cremea]